jgi:uncharacterized peroxidase-related enzyme
MDSASLILYGGFFMARLKIAEAQGELKETFSVIENDMGFLPNIFKYLGNFPPAIEAYFGIGKQLEKGMLTPEMRELISLAVSEENHCNYCLAAHTAIGKSMGANESILEQARRGESSDPKTGAILKFCKVFTQNRGNVTDGDVDTLKNAGVSDQEIVEIYLTIIHITFTNYFNHLNDTPVDFPQVAQLR